MMIIMIY